MKLHYLLFLALLSPHLSWASKKLRATVDSASFYQSSDRFSQVIGVFPAGSEITLVPGYEKLPGEFYFAEATSTKSGKSVQGFVLKSDFELLDSADKGNSSSKKTSAAKAKQSEPDFYPWSLGLGLSGTSNRQNTSVVITFEARYAWTSYFESIAAMEVSFGTEFAVGSQVGQRVYAPLNEFRPYIHGGYRIRDLTQLSSSAWEAGGGIQVLRSKVAYFEIGAVYLFRTAFDDNAENFWVFGGSSGLRF
jgi:hypothetical protein